MLDVGGGALDNPPIEIGGFKMLDVFATSSKRCEMTSPLKQGGTDVSDTEKHLFCQNFKV